MLIYLENFKKNTFVEINDGFSTCTMRMGKIGEEGTVRTYTSENMAEKLVLLKKSKGYTEVKQSPKYKMLFVFTDEKQEYQLFEKRVVVTYSYSDFSEVLNFANFELVLEYMQTRYFYDVVEGVGSIEYSDYPLDEFKKLSYFDIKKEHLKFAESIEGSLVQKNYEVKSSLIVDGDISVEENFMINCEDGKSIFHFKDNVSAKNLFVMETKIGLRDFDIFIDGDLEVDTIFLSYAQNLIVKGNVKVNTLIYSDVSSSLRIPKNGVKNYINTFKNKAIFKSKYFDSNYGLKTSSLQKAMLDGEDVYCSDLSSLEIRDEVFRTMPMILEEDWSDTYRFKSRNISIWDRWLYTTGDEHLLNDMSLEDSAENSAKFLKFHTLLLDKYEVLFANPSMSDDWKIYKKKQ